MTRARVRLGAASIGFCLILVELGFAAYSAAWVLGPPPPNVLGTTYSDHPSWAALIPSMLLLLASVTGGITLYRAIARGRSRWTWYVAALAPTAAVLAAYRPQLGVFKLRVEESGLPWASPLGAEHSALVYGLQLGLYVAIAAFVVATVLSVPGRRTRSAISVGSARP
jgi:hypothetical protein